jgi:hypothetical protein
MVIWLQLWKGAKGWRQDSQNEREDSVPMRRATWSCGDSVASRKPLRYQIEE